MRRLQTRAQRGRALGRRAAQAFRNQLITAADQRNKALVQRCQILFHRGGRHTHADFADLDAIGADRCFYVIHRWVFLRRIQDLVHGALTLAFRQQSFDGFVLAIQITRQVLALSVVVDHEQHIRIALRTARELRQRRRIAIPHRPWRDRSQQLGHVRR